MLRNVLALRHMTQRTISTASRKQIANRVPEYQKIFQEDNGIPVYLKGTGYVLYELFVAAMPKKQK